MKNILFFSHMCYVQTKNIFILDVENYFIFSHMRRMRVFEFPSSEILDDSSFWRGNQVDGLPRRHT